MYAGPFLEGETASLLVLVTNSNGHPFDPNSLPLYRVYGPSGPMAGQTGSLVRADSGTITNATNASPIVITSPGHNLGTGSRVTIYGVQGNAAANGSFVITRIGDDQFSLDGSTGSGDYSGGGVWSVAGLYRATLSLLPSSGYEPGQTYALLASWLDGVAQRSSLVFFSVD